MEEAHRAECIHGNVLQWPPQLNFSPWVNLTDQALSWSVYKIEVSNVLGDTINEPLVIGVVKEPII